MSSRPSKGWRFRSRLRCGRHRRGAQVVEKGHVGTTRRWGFTGSCAKQIGHRLWLVGRDHEPALALRADQGAAFQFIPQGQLPVAIRACNDLAHEIT